MSHERRIFWMAIAAGLPGSTVASIMLWTGDWAPKVQWTLSVVIVALWLGFAFAIRERTVLPLQTLANLLEALREGDYSIRGRPQREGALAEVMVEVNALGEVLRRQRFHAVDATTLLQQVIAEIDLAIFTFDADGVLRMVNRAGERLLGGDEESWLGRKADALGLEDLLEGEAARTVERAFAGRSGRWQLRRSTFREGGLPHRLLVLTDLSKALREEERLAWQRLIRVIGHELNNSLAPIQSTAATLATVLRREALPEDWRQDAQQGLARIADRCASLNRFVAAYARLARLPSPRPRPTVVEPLIRRVATLETRVRVTVAEGPACTVSFDPDQIEQLLINLVKNGADAVESIREEPAAAPREVRVRWHDDGGWLTVDVEDDGPGIASTANLFVPFYTTKPGGTGVGLVLCRQIAEAHGGHLSLVNRPHGSGCLATLRLPAGPRHEHDRETAPA